MFILWQYFKPEVCHVIKAVQSGSARCMRGKLPYIKETRPI